MANNLPTVTSPLPRDLQQFVQRVREALDGGGTEAVVTARQLIAAGVVTSNANGQLSASVATSSNVDIPSAPSNLTASGSLASIVVGWNGPFYRGHAYTEIWAHTSDVIGDAQIVGMTAGNNFPHQLGGTATRYYWVRNVNQNGDVSGFNATNGVSATTGTDAAYLLSVLAGEITSTQLSSSLSTKINLIDAAASVSGSVAQQVASEASARTTAIGDEATARATAIAAETAARTASISSLSSVVSQLTGTSAYVASTTYAANDLVTYNNNLYKSKQSTTGNLPTNTTFWDLVGNYSSISQVVVANAADISAVDTRVTTAEGTISSQQTALSTLQTEMNNTETATASNTTAINGLTTRVTSAEGTISTSSSAITALDTRLTTLDNSTNGTVGANTTAITDLDTRVTSAEGTITAQGSSITSLNSSLSGLTSTVGGNTTSITTNATALGALTTRVTSAEGTITTHSSDITSLSTSAAAAALGVSTNASAITALDTRVTSAEGTITSQASSITSLTSTVGGHTTSIGANTTAISNNATAITSNATAIGGLDTRVTSAENSITSQASDITTLTTNLSTANTSITANTTAIGGLTTRVTAAEGTITTHTSDITTLQTDMTATENATAANATAVGGLDTRLTSAESTITSQASDITSLNTSVTGLTTSSTGNATAISGLNTRVTAAEADITASANSLTSLSTSVAGNTSTLTTQGNSINGLGAQYTVKVDNNGHVAGFGLASTTIDGTPKSDFMVRADRFSIVSTTSARPDVIITSNINSTTYRMGFSSAANRNNFPIGASVYFVNHPDDEAAADKVFSVTAHGQDSTSGNYIDVSKDASVTLQDLNATTAASLGVKLGRNTIPFVVDSGDVIIDTAYIKDGSITSAKIGTLNADRITSGLLNTVDFYGNTIAGATIYIGGTATYTQDAGGNNVGINTVVNPKITMSATGALFDVNAFTIDNGAGTTTPFTVSGNTVFIDNAMIADGSISNAKIGNTIQSANYNSGSAGWKINKTGDVELNDATFRGTLDVGGSSGSRMKITSDKIEVYDGSTLRVKIGNLS